MCLDKRSLSVLTYSTMFGACVTVAVVHGVGAGGHIPSSHVVRTSSSSINASIGGDEGGLVASGDGGGPDMGDGVDRDMLTCGDENEVMRREVTDVSSDATSQHAD